MLPPIGAQGLNMGLRDAADIADIVAGALADNEDPGSAQALARASGGRAGPTSTAARWRSIFANRSLLSDFLPAQMVRALGMHLIGGYGPLRRLCHARGPWPRHGARLRVKRAAKRLLSAARAARSGRIFSAHITLVSVTTDTNVPSSTAADAGSIQAPRIVARSPNH